MNAMRTTAGLLLSMFGAATAQESRPAVMVLRDPKSETVRKDWQAILAHLRRGGSLVQIGGPPFGDAPEFARRLLLGPVDPTEFPVGGRLVAASGYDGPLPPPEAAPSLTVRFTTRKDFQDEDGTAGPRDAVLRPLVHVVDDLGVPRAAPIVEIDRLRGEYAGGRWIFATGRGPYGPDVLAALVARASQGASELDARPVHASVEPPELPRIRVALRRPGLSTAAARPVAVSVTIFRPDGSTAAASAELTGTEAALGADLTLPAASTPGLHRVVVALPGVEARPRTFETGFVVRDEAARLRGAKLQVSADWLTKDGRPFPVVGTTYMASDVHRKFLFEPNPAVWERDFALMARLGINFVRTGIWTGWTRVMLDVGAVDEGVLRALDAYVETAAAHGIVVCFTLFAFQPPLFGGVNPYLDPRALEGQRAWALQISRRYRGRPGVHYDLINEPSYSPADQLWTNRAIGDAFERAAWRAYLTRRFDLAEKDAAAAATRLAEAFVDASDDPWAVPSVADQSYSMTREQRAPRRAAEFGRFTNEVVAAWAADLRRALRAAGGDDVLVTLGQDEGGTEQRPAQLLHAHALDYTALHNWWKNDDLLWDGLASKAEGVPNLVSETGLMRLEDLDGRPWRTPEAAALLLERKCALAFGARGAGVVQWAWNINPYMPIDNESTIGIFRPDGTAKPELDVLRRFASFAGRAASRLGDFAPPAVAVVLPFDRIWSGRPKGFDGAKRIVRVLADSFGVAAACVPPFAPSDRPIPARKLVIYPAGERFHRAPQGSPLPAGTMVLRFGPGDDEDGVPVALREPHGERTYATFDQNAGEWLRRSGSRRIAPDASTVLWREPLPLDHAREEEPLRQVLGEALRIAGVAVSPSDVPSTATVWLTKDAALVTVVNESSQPLSRRVFVDQEALDVRVAPGRARCLLVDRLTLAVLADSDTP